MMFVTVLINYIKSNGLVLPGRIWRSGILSYYRHHRGFPKLAVFVNSHLADTEEEPALFSDPDLELVAINHHDHLRQRLYNNHRIPRHVSGPWNHAGPRTVTGQFCICQPGLAWPGLVWSGLETVYKSQLVKSRGRCSVVSSHLWPEMFVLSKRKYLHGQLWCCWWTAVCCTSARPNIFSTLHQGGGLEVSRPSYNNTYHLSSSYCSS